MTVRRPIPARASFLLLLLTACLPDRLSHDQFAAPTDATEIATGEVDDPDTPTPDTTTDTGPGACQVASDCPNPLDLCVAGTCKPQTPCVSDKQCSDFGFVCDQVNGVCVTCLADADCGGAQQKCLAQTCVDPGGTCASSKECPSGQVCDKPNGVCVGCTDDIECAATQHCVDTVCVGDLCHDGELACADPAHRKVCAANGSGWTTEACEAGMTCLDGTCAKLLCTPGAKSCAEGQNAVQTCNGTGTAWAAPTACTDKTTCKDGACQPQMCTPDQKKCNAQGGMDTCTADGLALTSAACPAGQDEKPQICATENGQAVCKGQACAPDSAFCQQGKVMKCDAQGLTAAQTADCTVAAAGGATQVCLDGKCAPAACKAGDKACADPTTLATCKAGGDGYENTACGQGNACENGACQPTVCVPAQLGCEAGKAVKCSPGGTQNTVIDDCQAKGKVCVQGACVAKVCSPNIQQCQGGQMGTCKPDGTGWTLAPCPQGETCSGGKCTSKLCEPDTQDCNGAVVAVCNGGGTAWVTIDDCPKTGKTCQNGACVEVQSGFRLSAGFASLADEAAGAYRIIERRWVATSGQCKGTYCVQGGFSR